jgi:hypothetical protein
LKLFQEWRGGIKENNGGGEFKYDICYIVRTFVNVTMYSHPAQLKKSLSSQIF